MIDKIGIFITWLLGMGIMSPILIVAIKQMKEDIKNFAKIPKKYSIILVVLFIAGCLVYCFGFLLILFVFKY